MRYRSSKISTLIIFVVFSHVVGFCVYYFKPRELIHGEKYSTMKPFPTFGATSKQKKIANGSECQFGEISMMQVTPSFTRVALLSYPGSGNTWMRILLQRLTGYCTGSVYCDSVVLPPKDFPGECIHPASTTKGCIVYKSHRYTEESVKSYDKAIILIRNPFDSINTLYNFLLGSKLNRSMSSSHGELNQNTIPERFKKNGNPFQGTVLKSQYNSSIWHEHVLNETGVWRESNSFWLEAFKGKHLLVRYEDLKQDPVFTLRRISKYLNVKISERRYRCVTQNQKGKYHRQQRYKIGIKDIYNDTEIHKLNEAIRYVNNIVKFEENLENYLQTRNSR